ncbi:MAG: thioredoxin family protein [Alkalispirochaetaceae bacterium]
MNKEMNDALFSSGYDAPEYVANLRNYRSLVKQLMDEAEADSSHAEELARLAAEYPQPVRATMMTEDWCGDSACNTPILASLFAKADIPFKALRGSEHEPLKEGYEREGTDHIPVISLWDGRWQELVRWVEAPEAVSRKKEQWKAERPEFMELYAKQKSDTDAAKKFASLYREFLETMAEWYRSDLWSETTREIVDKLAAKGVDR